MIAVSPLAHAQWGVNAVVISPTAERDYTLKTGIGGGIQYSSLDEDERFFISFYLNYYNHQFERDTFYTYGYTNDLNNSGAFGFADGYEVLSDYKGWLLGSRMYYRLFDQALTPTVGFDISFISEQFKANYEGIGINSRGDAGNAYVGIAPSIGLSFLYGDFHFTLNTNYQFMITRNSFPKQWVTSLGIVYLL